MQIACACASASIAAASDIVASLSSICLVMVCAKAGPRATELSNALDEGACHAGELEQAAGVLGEELGDDPLDVAAGAEAAALAGDQHSAALRAVLEGAERRRELTVDLEGEGVEAVGP